MLLLSIDTSAGTSVAIVDGGRGVVVEHGEPDTRRHAEVIGDLISRCLADAEVAVTALTGVAVGMGPGPFTGLRVGIAAAQAFALGAGVPLLRVVSHDAIAYGHYAAGARGPLLVVTDARRRELYCSGFEDADAHGIPIRVGQPTLAAPADIPTLVGPERAERFDAAQVSAGDVGMLAAAIQVQGGTFAGEEPLYLRSPDVTLPAGPKRVSA